MARQILLFLFCLFLAFIIWTLHKLSEDQTVYLQYKLQVSVNLQGRAADAVSVEPLVVKGIANGFYVLKQYYSNSSNVIKIETGPKFLKKTSGSDDLFYIKASDIQNEISGYLADNVKSISISSDTLFFKIPRRSTKKVPVVAKINHYPAGAGSLKVKVTPDFVTVFGSRGQINRIDTVYTEPVDYNGLVNNKSGVISLTSVPGIKFSVYEVYYSLEIQKK